MIVKAAFIGSMGVDFIEAGRALDLVIAEKVMGEVVGADRDPFDGVVAAYSTDWRAAGRVVERFTGAQKAIGHDGGADLLDEWQFRLQWNHHWMWDAQFDHRVDRNSVGSDITEFFAQAPTAPHAICLAALKAVGASID